MNGQTNRLFEKPDNSLGIGGLTYLDTLCNFTSINNATSTTLPVTAFKITGQCSSTVPIEFTASIAESALYSRQYPKS